MSTKLLMLLSLFFISLVSSLAWAHPNHMSFEQVQHNTDQINSVSVTPDKLNHTAIEEKHEHSDAVPCTQQQHKAVPCKRK